MSFSKYLKSYLLASVAITLAACEQPLDFDMRGAFGSGLDTAEAARMATAKRPDADDRGVISYPNYQVAVARRDDTVTDLAARVGADAAELARYNGLQPDDNLRAGEVVALPRRVAEPSPETGSPTTGPIQPPGIDITTLAGGAIDRAGEQEIETTTLESDSQPEKQKVARGLEPKRHKVVRGETVYTISRLYDVSVRSLAEWNGLGSDFKIREGQYLLIPVPETSPPERTTAEPETEPPGRGSPTPTPPSATQPLPEEGTQPVAESEPAETQSDSAPEQRQAETPSGGELAYPVKGRIIREYSKGKNDGIDFTADPGEAVTSAEAGTVVSVTKSTENVQFVVIKHSNSLATVYVNVDKVSVANGDQVTRGQKIAEMPEGNPPYVQFQVAKGTAQVDPMPYLQ
ncbi:MAG: Peptidase, M23/M37 family [Rhodobacteraceae bacterium HLUCCO07]|nr:MAG: Peptidase, M23/M37 family [Rhodobacteraceae bacterium HLUCCO07]